MDEFRGLSRREFLKLLSLVPAGLYSRPLSRLAGAKQEEVPKIILTLDPCISCTER